MSNESGRGRRTAILAPLLAASVGLAAPALLRAQEPRREHVQVSDLNLYSYQGQRSLERRVRAAIMRVCASPVAGGMPTPGTRERFRDCRQNAWESVQRQLEVHGLPPVQIAIRR